MMNTLNKINQNKKKERKKGGKIKKKNSENFPRAHSSIVIRSEVLKDQE